MRTYIFRPTACAILALFLVFGLAKAASAQHLRLTDLSLDNVHGRVTARFNAGVVEMPVLKGELMDGSVLLLKCRASLMEVNEYWLNDDIAEAVFWSILRYDSLTNEFVLTSSSHQSSLKGPGVAGLVASGWEGIEITLGSWALLDKGSKYVLKVDAALNERDSPEGIMRYILLWEWDPPSTKTIQLEFTH